MSLFFDKDVTVEINVWEYQKKGQSTMDNPYKLATRRRKTKQKQNTICVGHHYSQANTNNVTKRCALLQTTGCKDEPTRLIYLQVNLFHLFSYLG